MALLERMIIFIHLTLRFYKIGTILSIRYSSFCVGDNRCEDKRESTIVAGVILSSLLQPF